VSQAGATCSALLAEHPHCPSHDVRERLPVLLSLA
jgi:hypothetical protein